LLSPFLELLLHMFLEDELILTSACSPEMFAYILHGYEMDSICILLTTVFIYHNMSCDIDSITVIVLITIIKILTSKMYKKSSLMRRNNDNTLQRLNVEDYQDSRKGRESIWEKMAFLSGLII